MKPSQLDLEMALIASPSTVALLSLMKIRGFGRRRALKIVATSISETDYGVCCKMLAARITGLFRVNVSSKELMDAWKKSEEQIEKSYHVGIQTISFHDKQYPFRLRTIFEPPVLLFVRGRVDALNSEKSIALVGTRKPTSYGELTAQRYARAAAEDDFAIVSGLAHGCDTLGHKGCLEARGVGVAVLAHGLDMVYPAANRDLAERLIEQGGCLVSEHPIETRPVRSAFAERNRIQSGLSDAVLIIETGTKGGTVYTAKFALRQRRRLLCLDHPANLLDKEEVQGNRHFIENGSALAVGSEEDLMRILNSIHRANSKEAPGRQGSNLEEEQKSWAF